MVPAVPSMQAGERALPSSFPPTALELRSDCPSTWSLRLQCQTCTAFVCRSGAHADTMREDLYSVGLLALRTGQVYFDDLISWTLMLVM